MLKLASPFDVVPGVQFSLPPDRGLGITDEAADVAPAHVEFHGDAAASVLARDLRRAVDQRDFGELRERDARAVRRRDEQTFDRLHVLTRSLTEPHDEAVALFALIDLPDLLARDDGLDHVVYVLDVEAVARDGCAVDRVGTLRQPGPLLDLHGFGASLFADGAGDLAGLPHERVEVVAEELDGDVGAHPGAQVL